MMDGKPKTCDSSATLGEPDPQEARTEDPRDVTITSQTVSNSASTLDSLSSASKPATLARLQQLQAQAAVSGLTYSLGSLDTVSLHQLQQTISGHQPLSGLTGQYLPIATVQVPHATPALSLTLPRNMAAVGLTPQDAAQTALSLPQTSLPHPASVQPGLGSYFSSHTSPPTNHVHQRLQYLLDIQAPPSRLAVTTTNAPHRQDQSQYLHQLLQEIRIRIHSVAMILEQRQTLGNGNSSRLAAVSDDTLIEIIAMSGQQQGSGVPNSLSSILNQIGDQTTITPHGTASYPSRLGTDPLVAQLLSQLGGAASNCAGVNSMNHQIDQLLSQQTMASAHATDPTDIVRRQGADRPAKAADGELETFAYPPLPVNQAPPSLASHPSNEMSGRSPTGVSTSSPQQSVASHQKDHQQERDMNPNQLKEERWMARYKEMKEIHGHCRVPHGYRDNRPLSWWVMNQRAHFQLRREGKKSWLSGDRVELLNMIGFDWRSPIGGRPKKK